MNVTIIIIAAAVCVAYVCRINLLQYKEHRLSFILLHIGLFGASCGAAVSAWTGALHLQDLCTLVGSAAWIFVSMPSWRGGEPPVHARRIRPLTSEECRRVVGAGRE